jgi:leucyl-tRNA synthetase
MSEAIEVAIRAVEEKQIGTRKMNYKMRDAAFSRQRYWGEPFPIRWNQETASSMPQSCPWSHPTSIATSPAPTRRVRGQLPRLGKPGARDQYYARICRIARHFLRFMDPHNATDFCGRKQSDYWNQVDLYIGGTEHAVGHLLYSRMWTKVLFDLGLIGYDEPFKRLLNQGMIQGSSRFVYRKRGTNNFVS